MIRFRFGGAAREIFITLSSKSVVRMTDSKKYVPYLSTYFLLKLCFISMRYTSHSSMEPDLTPLWILSCSCVPAMHADQPDCAQQDWTTNMEASKANTTHTLKVEYASFGSHLPYRSDELGLASFKAS